MGYRIKDWKKFQHFKDRRPPWIKLYRDILDDPDWHNLDSESSKTLVMLWLVASEDEQQKGCLPDTRKLAFRLRMTEKQLLQQLTRLKHWLIQDDVTIISERYQVDAPETETETETEKSPTAPVIVFDDIPFKEIISHLNEIAQTSYRHASQKTRGLIKARWNEGYRLEDFQIVHENKVRDWFGDPKMQNFLRPETLYSPKFESYRNQPPPQQHSQAGIQGYLGSQEAFRKVFSDEETG